MDYANLSLADVTLGLEDTARDAHASFGGYDAHQLNWQPDAAMWSVGQCFDHLLKVNQLMLEAVDRAFDDAVPRSVWQRLPVLPGVVGRMMVRSQAPGAGRKFVAPTPAKPALSNIGGDVVQRFVNQQRDAAARLRTLDQRAAAHTIMTSPFAGFLAYSVLDGWRLMFAHGRRHVEQARAVTRGPGFPGRSDAV